ncbi:glycosyltransferase family 2 protein [Microbacterium sp. SS28]|uniref:glycosyltransferase family 2 protein n=1 Tax=Microbacterium sp. SS28 TaxID=2919948 RepID=UPI001FAA0589|nr:glycosyltransferase family 2 protein [Microbacterium sp. SS28]
MAIVTGTAGVVLAYNPEPEILVNVKLLSQQVDRVYVVDNSSEQASNGVLAELALDPSVRLLPQGENVGVAAGFNAGMRAALDHGYDDVWIFDQDSTVTEGMLARLRTARAQFGDRAGVVGPALRSHATGVVYARESGRGAVQTDVIISSGSLFSRSMLEQIGLHDEPLFIDYVDHDICLRARKSGFRNLKVFDAILDHRFGDAEPVRLFGRAVYLANYSTLRHFYAARNRIVVVRRYGFGRWFWEDLWFTGKAWVKLVLLESERWSKIRAASRGIWAGLRYDL